MKFKSMRLSAVAFACFVSAVLSGCGGAPGQQEQYAALPALNFAGLKAGMACSAIFVSGRPLDKVMADELDGLLAGAAMTENPIADLENMNVQVRYDLNELPRVAVYRPGRGCTILPPGASADKVATLPNPEIGRKAIATSEDNWSDGPAQEPNVALAAAMEAALDGRTYGKGAKTIGVVVIHRGKLVAEKYRVGFGPHTQYRAWSSAKMLTNALIGILVGQGKLELDEPPGIPEWSAADDPRAKITVEHLLHMSSGLEKDGAGAYPVYHNGADIAQITTAASLEVPPGSRWSYANRDTLLLVRAMRSALGDEDYWRFPVEDLLDRIGMHDTILESDPYGNYILSSQVYSTPRDLARLGLLFLQDGVWDNDRILPEGWVDFSIQPAPARKRGIGALLAYGLDGFLGYGAQVWLYKPIPGLISYDAYSGIGHRGQYITVIPSEELVVVRMGLDPEEGDVLWRQDQFFTDIIVALDDSN